MGGKKFEIQGPPGGTEAQARAVFDKQVNTGALVGFKPGDELNAVKQASSGLAAAAGQVTQAISGTPGLTTGALGTAFSSAGQQFTAALGSATSVAQQTLTGITRSLAGTPVTNGINIAEFAKQVPSLTSISGLNTQDVRAAMSQTSTLVGQATSQFSDTLGVGKFGFDASQLENAGLLKTGTVATYLSQGANQLTNVLKSPAVWTGKDGINNLDSLLSNPAAQNLTQQNLMSSGLNAVKQLGIPVSQLNTKSLAGVALNAAKSPTDTLAWAKGQLPADLKSQFDIVAKDAAFSVDFAEQKLNDAVAQLAPPGEAEDTVDRATLDAAVTRIFGNDKIPEPNYGPSTKDSLSDDAFADKYSLLYADVLNNYINPTGRVFQSVENKISALQNQQTITLAQFQEINAEFQAAREKYNSEAPAKIGELNSFVEQGTARQQRVIDDERLSSSRTKLLNLIQYLLKTSTEIKEQLRLLRGKIQG